MPSWHMGTDVLTICSQRQLIQVMWRSPVSTMVNAAADEGIWLQRNIPPGGASVAGPDREYSNHRKRTYLHDTTPDRFNGWFRMAQTMSVGGLAVLLQPGASGQDFHTVPGNETSYRLPKTNWGISWCREGESNRQDPKVGGF
jgi:hypothetical protein